MIKINDEIPNFEILTDTGDFKVSNHKGKKIVGLIVRDTLFMCHSNY